MLVTEYRSGCGMLARHVSSMTSGRTLGILLIATVLPLAGAETCAKCHGSVHREWQASRHGRVLQPATAASVQGDFARGRVVLDGRTYVLSSRAGQYFITESELTGKPVEHRLEYTLGERRL